MAATPEMLDGAWERTEPSLGSRNYAPHLDELWITRQPGATLTFRFRGTDASLLSLIGPDHGRVRVMIDGREAGVHGRVDRWCHYHRFSATPLVSGAEDAEHTVTVELLPEPPNRSEPIEEAKRLGIYDPEDFEGVALYVGWLRIVGQVVK